MSDAVLISLVVTVGAAVNSIIGILGNRIASRAADSSARAETNTHETKAAVHDLVQQTNGITADLVKGATEAGLVKGIEIGRQAGAIGPAGPAGPVGPQGDQGDPGPRGRKS